MDLSSIQKEVDEWVGKHGGYWPPLSMFARLVEETGELGRELNHVFGVKKRKQEEKIKEISDEIGDVFLTLVLLSNSLNLDLEKIFDKTMEKVKVRDNDRTNFVQ
ncbi:nucleotide pyrophosphohydrolase [Candidatus Woesearchaeota archaeon]|nr:MAG: nucleotide pyrophosphohydrolase [Candidatus Woesearchaeota archaeon ex4484_78]RLE44715.1 MAG: nucleotide pyrophosphohydrolase [Candidatus Woesearchaeota archaeon]